MNRKGACRPLSHRPGMATIALVAIAAVVAVLAGTLILGRGASERSGVAERLAPIIDASDLDGERWTSAALRGRWGWVSFWSPSCGPCSAELAMMQRVSSAYRGRVQIVSVAVGAEAAEVREVVKRYSITYPVLLDPDGRNYLRWAPGYDMPRHYFVAPDGIVVAEIRGPLPPAYMPAVLEKILGNQSAPAGE